MWTLSDVFILAESVRRFGLRSDLAVPDEHVALYMSPYFALGVVILREYITFWNSVLVNLSYIW